MHAGRITAAESRSLRTEINRQDLFFCVARRLRFAIPFALLLRRGRALSEWAPIDSGGGREQDGTNRRPLAAPGGSYGGRRVIRNCSGVCLPGSHPALSAAGCRRHGHRRELGDVHRPLVGVDGGGLHAAAGRVDWLRDALSGAPGAGRIAGNHYFRARLKAAPQFLLQHPAPRKNCGPGRVPRPVAFAGCWRQARTAGPALWRFGRYCGCGRTSGSSGSRLGRRARRRGW